MLTDSAPLPVLSFLTACPRKGWASMWVCGQFSAAVGHDQGNSKDSRET